MPPFVNSCTLYAILEKLKNTLQTFKGILPLDNEFRLSIDVLKKKLVSIGADDSLQTEILKLYATNSSANTQYGIDFFSDL